MQDLKKFIINFFLFYCFLNTLAFCQIQIQEPQELANEFNDSLILGSTGSFGVPYYDDRISGEILYFPTTGCKESDYSLDSGKFFHLNKIVMIQRGLCKFSVKVQIAESKGAKAVIIADTPGSNSTSEMVQRIIITHDGWADNIKIPSILISDTDSSIMLKYIEQNKRISVELVWNIPKDHAVNMDLWMSPSIKSSMKFLKEFAPYAMKLKTKLDFRPHYWIMSLDSQLDDMCSDNKGKYCVYNPENSKITGKDIVKETVRQLCLLETTQYENFQDENSGLYSELWWKYIEKIDDECLHNLNKKTNLMECSYDLMTSLNVDIEEIKKCYEEEFEYLLNNELDNKGPSTVSLIINNWIYSGPFDSEIVSRAVCSGFVVEPEECKKLIHPSIVEIEKEINAHSSKFPVWLIVLLSLIVGLVGISIILLIFWKLFLNKFKNRMRYVVMNEVRKELSMFDNNNVLSNTSEAPKQIYLQE